MNTQQACALIGETFPQTFDKGRFGYFAVNLLNRIDETKAQAWNTTYIKDAFKPHVHKFECLGTYTSPDKEKLDVLIVHLTTESKLGRARTAIRNFVADYLKTRDNKDAALVAFVSPTEKQWRFSYVKMEYAAVETDAGRVGVETRLTPARRYSYIVGEGESCHTAQTRFLALLQDTENFPKLAQLEEAFSVEAVTKEFFTKYRALFEEIEKELRKLAAKDKTIGDEFKEKNVSTVDFAKKLMGQIVFLYFLQKKGWLGVAKGQDWGTGQHDFLRRLAHGDHGAYGNFFNDVLEPLFYHTLATDRGHEAWCNRFKCRIPFLNGGLFEPLGNYDWRKTDILLPNRLFTNGERFDELITGTGVLDVFDRYNFTVNEAEPLEKEVAIDPEMLGKVFENLIEDNRRKGLGSFYTPREIVHYMCQESLINYLDTALNHPTTPIGAATPQPEKQPPLFVDSSEKPKARAAQEEFTEVQHRVLVARKDLEGWIRQSDQFAHYAAAIAAGTKGDHYPKPPDSIRKFAHEIDVLLRDITVCDLAIGSGAFPVGMMTEIVRARMALTPYFNDVAERTAYHFKRHAIQNSIYGVDIDAGAVEIAKLRLWLSLVVDEEDVRQIKPLPNLDYKIVVGNSLLGFPLRSPRVQKIEKLKDDYFDETDHDKKLKLKHEIDSELAQAFAASKASLGYEVTFDFQIYFSEVFRANKGFDVVIANPPYVSVEKFARTVIQNVWKRTFKTFAARGDIYCFFYEQGLTLLRPGGVLTFITSNKFQRAGYGKALRQLLAEQQIHTLIDFCELPVFAAATDPMIVIASKATAVANREFPVLVVKDEAEFSSLAQSIAMRASRYKSEQLKGEGWSLEGSDGLAIVDKLRATGTPLGEYVGGKLYYGIKTGLNEAFVIDRTTRDRLVREDRNSAKLIKPWIRGKDIKRWKHAWCGLYFFQIPSSENMVHPWSGKAEKAALTNFKATYPAIAEYLLAHENDLRIRTDKGAYFWELRSCAYWDAFAEPKIVMADIGKHLKASWCEHGHFIGNTGYIIANAEQFTLAVLLGTVTDWYARMTFQGLGDPWEGGRMRFINRNLVTIPVPTATAADKAKLTKLAERAAKSATAGDDAAVARIEREIDEIIYRLFDLTPAEITHIETALANTRHQDSEDDNDEDEP